MTTLLLCLQLTTARLLPRTNADLFPLSSLIDDPHSRAFGDRVPYDWKEVNRESPSRDEGKAYEDTSSDGPRQNREMDKRKYHSCVDRIVMKSIICKDSNNVTVMRRVETVTCREFSLTTSCYHNIPKYGVKKCEKKFSIVPGCPGMHLTNCQCAV